MKTPAFLATCTALALGAFSLTAASAASAWVETPEPNAGALFSVAALTDSDVWAVGFGYGSPALTLTQHWDGSAWSVVPSPNPSTKGEHPGRRHRHRFERRPGLPARGCKAACIAP